MKTPNVNFGLLLTRPNILIGIMATPSNFRICKLLLVLLLTIVPAEAQDVECPKAELILPSGLVNIEQEATAVLRIVGDFTGSVAWKVSSGTIVKGQGSQTLTVMPEEEDEGKTIKVTAKLLGLPGECTVEVSNDLIVAPLPIGEPVDVLEKVGGDRVARSSFLSRLDGYFSVLLMSPDYEGLVEVDFSVKDSRNHKLRHLRTILGQLRFRDIEPTRITFYISEYSGPERTALWTAAPGARIPKYMRSLTTIKGEEFEQVAPTLFLKKK